MKLARTHVIELTLGAFLAGLFLAKFGFTADLILLVVLVPFLIFIRRRSLVVVLPLVVLALMLGVWRGQTLQTELSKLFELHNQEATLHGVIADDPGFHKDGRVEFHLANLRDESGTEMRGRVRIRGYGGPVRYNRGDAVEVSGELRPALGNRQGQMSFAAITLQARKQTKFEDFRKAFFAGNYTALPEPEASLGLGFLVGLRALLPDSLLDDLGSTGLTHIVAVSGYNLTILVLITRRLFSKRSKFLAAASSVALIGFFIAVTGLSPSIFRAAIVSALSLAAWYYGRPIKSLIIILLAATMTAGINPTYLWYDIGWYLSFLAFFGVLVIAPAITARFFAGKAGIIESTFIETSSAQLMVTPIIAFFFNEVSLISLPANMMILPLIPLAMILTFIAALAGMLVPDVAAWFAWPAQSLLTLMINTVQWLARFSWSELSWTLSLSHMLLLYLAIAIFVVSIKSNIFTRSRKYEKHQI